MVRSQVKLACHCNLLHLKERPAPARLCGQDAYRVKAQALALPVINLM